MSYHDTFPAYCPGNLNKLPMFQLILQPLRFIRTPYSQKPAHHVQTRVFVAQCFLLMHQKFRDTQFRCTVPPSIVLQTPLMMSKEHTNIAKTYLCAGFCAWRPLFASHQLQKEACIPYFCAEEIPKRDAVNRAFRMRKCLYG